MKKIYLLMLMLLVAVTMSAQVTTSSISGKITDEKKQPIVGAAVVVIHTSSGTQSGAVTDTKGNYRIMNLRPGGPYLVEIQMLGFQSTEFKNINLILDDNYVLNAQLKEETRNIDAVVVSTKGSSNMNSDRAGAVTNINAKNISLMPSASRSINDLTRLAPQANGTSIGGGNYRQNFISIDGASFNNNFGIGSNMPANGSPISLDALEQISINVTPYDVRQSGFIGAAINAVTRSGDNEFRGSIYTYMNNEKFKGNKVGDAKFERNDSRYNMYGMRFGGPIVKNKLFFFVNYEYDKTIEPGPARVAATDENPYTDGKNNVARPTVDQMNEMGNYLSSKYGYDAGPYQGYSSESPSQKFLARLDWNISKNHKLNIRYNITKAKSPMEPSISVNGLTMKPYGSLTRIDMSAIYFANAKYYNGTNYSSLAAELNSTFGGKFYNTLRAAYSNQDEPRSTDGGEFPFVDILEDGKPLTCFGTELFSYGNLRAVKTFSVTDDITWSAGINNFTAGLMYEWNKTENGFQRFGTGYYCYKSWDDFVGNKTPITFAITHSNSPGFKQAFPSFVSQQLSAYFQDELTLSPNFKLTAGIRFDIPFYPDINHSFNKAVADTDINGTKYNTATLPKTTVTFSPRIGFNYDILKDRSLVLRGGTGIFTGRIPFVWIVSQSADAGVLQTTYSASGADAPKFYPNRMDILNSIYPNGAREGGSTLPYSITMMDRNFKMPQTWKTSIALDAQLPGGIRGSLEGIYNKNINAAVFTNKGLKDPVAWNNGTGDNRMVYPVDKYYNGALKNVYLVENGKGGYYWSATAKFEKNFRWGLNAMIAYTHSEAKNTTDGSGDQVSSAWQNTPAINGSNSHELAYAGYVIPDKIIAAVTYRKEYAKFMATSISLFYQGGSQGRYSYTYSSGISNDGSYNALIYIPKDASEIDFADYTYENGGKTITYLAADQAKDFWAYVEGDDYLRSNKGKYAKRNAGKYPWVSTFDIKITQDFFVNVKGKRNTIQVGLDIMNVGNLLNKNWGNQYFPYLYGNNVVLSQTAGSKVGVKPKYNFQRDGVMVKNNEFAKYMSYSSTYFMQLSFRYIFN